MCLSLQGLKKCVFIIIVVMKRESGSQKAEKRGKKSFVKKRR